MYLRPESVPCRSFFESWFKEVYELRYSGGYSSEYRGNDSKEERAAAIRLTSLGRWIVEQDHF